MTLLNDTNVTAAKKSVNWTNDPVARALVAEFKSLKATEKLGKDAEKRRKEVVEPALNDKLAGAQEAIVRGNVVIRVSSLRHSVKVDMEQAKALGLVSESPYTFLQTL